MSELRNRMLQDLRLAGLTEGTRRVYVRAVEQLATYFWRSPDQLEERQVEQFLLYVRDELGVAKGTFEPLLAGLRFFYVNTLGCQWPLFLKKRSACRWPSGCPTSAATPTAAA
jgi:integrase/recombinase XerD